MRACARARGPRGTKYAKYGRVGGSRTAGPDAARTRYCRSEMRSADLQGMNGAGVDLHDDAKRRPPLTVSRAGEILLPVRSMPSLPPEDLLPVLVADLADDEAQEVLEAAAFTGSQVYVPLDAAPVNATEHVLEVHIPSMAEPLFFLALPLGPPTAEGFPMRIRAMPDAAPTGRTEAPPGMNGVVRGRRSTTGMTLSASHTADLERATPLPTGAGRQHPRSRPRGRQAADRDADRSRRRRRRLQGAPSRAPHAGRREGAPRVVPARHRLLSPVLRRGARGEPARSPEHHARHRLRSGARRAPLPRDGVPRRRRAPRAARQGGRAPGAAHRRDHDADVRGALARARSRHRPSRHQAREPRDRSRSGRRRSGDRAREGLRLRDRAASRLARLRTGGRYRRGNARVHVARAVSW